MDEESGPPGAQLTIADGTGDTGLVVRLAGELDLASVGLLAAPLEELLGRPPQPLVLDLSELTFMDSSGIAVLIRVANHFEQLETRGAQPAVRRVIEVLGLADRVGLRRA
jgi:anti-anti-sigma factor